MRVRKHWETRAGCQSMKMGVPRTRKTDSKNCRACSKDQSVDWTSSSTSIAYPFSGKCFVTSDIWSFVKKGGGEGKGNCYVVDSCCWRLSVFTGCFGRGDELDELVNEYPLFKHNQY